MLRTLLAIGLILLAASPSFAGPPLNGTYFSVDLGGSVFTGHGTESWPDDPADGSRGIIGNTVSAKSWDGINEATQWALACPSLCADPMLLNDNLDANLTGYQTWRHEYCGGFIWMNGIGEAWDGGDAAYTATIANFISYVTYQFYEGVVIGSVANISLTALFDGYDTCMEFVIANATGLGVTDIDGEPLQTLPPGFPAFMGADCSETSLRGSWADVTGMSMVILGCSTATEDTSWSHLKNLYR